MSSKAHQALSVAVMGIFVFAVAFGLHWAFDGTASRPGSLASSSRDLAAVLARASHNNPVAEYELYKLYSQGDAGRRDEKDSRVWLWRAAEHGLPDAQYELAVTLRDGRGVVQDYQHAAKWMKLAALAGHAPAQYDLGVMFRSGMGVPADLPKSYVWLTLAAAQSFPGAAATRDAVLPRLSSEEILAGQAEARRMNETLSRLAGGDQAY